MENSQKFQDVVSRIAVKPEKLVHVCTADEIFAELKFANRKIGKADDEARTGDFVLCRWEGREGSKEISLCVGQKTDVLLDGIIEGRKAGDKIEIDHEGAPVLVEVLHVKRPCQFDLETGNFEELHIKGVKTREDYANNYVETRREQIAREKVMRILTGIENQFVNIVMEDMERPTEEFLEEYGRKAQERQIKMLTSYYKGDEHMLEVTLQSNFHKGSLEANEAEFAKKGKRTYMLGLAAEPVMEEMGYEVTEEEYEENLRMNMEALHMSEEECRSCYTMDDYRKSLFERSLQMLLLEEFAKKVQVRIEL